MEIIDNIKPITYSVNNSIEIIELFCEEEIKYDDADEYEIILNSLKNIHKQYEEYMKAEKNIELKEKANILNSFYMNLNELQEKIEQNLDKKIIINLSANEEKNKLLITLYKKMFNDFNNLEVLTDKFFSRTRVIIKQNNKIMK